MEESEVQGLATHTKAQAKFIKWLYVIHQAFAELSNNGPKTSTT